MTEFEALYYDGKTSARLAVKVRGLGRRLQVVGTNLILEVALTEVVVDPPVPGTPRAIHLPGGAQLQTDDHAALETLFPRANRLEGWVRDLERQWRYALAALALVVAVSAWGVIYGLPLAAHLAAGFVSPELEARLGEQTLSSIDGGFCAPSGLDSRRQRALRESFGSLTAGLGDGYKYRLELRACGRIGPNAFALPGGPVVLTDDLVRLAQNDAQIAAVLAHEISHVRHRHGLRTALQAAGLAALIASLAGDAVSITTLAVTLPTALLQSGYSRDFEDEADTYAFQRLKEVGLSPVDFAAIMTRLEEHRHNGANPAKGDRKAAGAPRDYLSTHPATAKRIERALAYR